VCGVVRATFEVLIQQLADGLVAIKPLPSLQLYDSVVITGIWLCLVLSVPKVQCTSCTVLQDTNIEPIADAAEVAA
jgi:hypothetical protein